MGNGHHEPGGRAEDRRRQFEDSRGLTGRRELPLDDEPAGDELAADESEADEFRADMSDAGRSEAGGTEADDSEAGGADAGESGGHAGKGSSAAEEQVDDQG